MTNTRQSQITEHMPEPWAYDHMASVRDAPANIIADCAITPECEGFTPTQEQEIANARRLCAAVNACQGISTDALEQGVIRELLEGLMDLLGDLPAVQEGVCRRCGREYDDIETGDCPSDDCPSFKARAAIAKITSPQQTAELPRNRDDKTFCAKTDLQGDIDHSQSVMVDFEPERERKTGRAAILLLDLIRHGALSLYDGDAEFQGTVYAFDAEAPDWQALVNAVGWEAARAGVAQATGRPA